MKLICVLAAIILSSPAVAQIGQIGNNDLLPVPASMRLDSGRLQVGAHFTVTAGDNPSSTLTSAVQRMLTRLEARTGFQVSHDLKQRAAILIIRCGSDTDAAPTLGDDESYSLDITATQAVLSANRTTGALRGLETFLQLVQNDDSEYFVPAASIQDHPRFPWRGLLVDVSRHFEPVDVIKQILDGMAALKMNVFHWHLTDDQGFRIESKKLPKLHQMGSDGLFYTQEQVKDIVAYASARGIRVVPEFDMPGHSTAWFVDYPELASAPGPYQIERRFGVFDPTFDPTNDRVYKFLDKFYGEMAKLFPDTYVHIGGDESNGKQWDANPRIQEFKKKHDLKDNAALQAYFNQRLQKILRKHGKKMIGWDEIFHPDLPKDIVVQSWRGDASLAAGARQGYAGILSAPYYLDHMASAAELYARDPLPRGSDLTPDQARLILGGEACMWAELVTPEIIQSRIFPRLGAIAERLWSPRDVNEPADMYRRLDRVSVLLEELGLAHKSQTERMLRRMLQTDRIEPMMVLADAVQPVSLSQRAQMENITQLTPLTRFVDAVVPDPESGRDLNALVIGLLGDAPRHERGRLQLTELFTTWHGYAPEMRATVRSHPVLEEIMPRVQELDSLSQVGLQALAYLKSGSPAPADWTNASLLLLDEAGKPKGMVRFVVLDPIRKLVLAAGKQNAFEQ